MASFDPDAVGVGQQGHEHKHQNTSTMLDLSPTTA
jgi:hypothetical protein